MGRIHVTKRIAAPLDDVFRAVADIRNFSKAVPHIKNVEFLTKQHLGVGTRFRETRVMHGKEAATELEVTEYVDNDRIRLVADSHGSVWDTVFSVRSETGGETELAMTMESRPYKLFPMLIFPLIRNTIANAVEQDMDAVKKYCEG